MEKIREEKSQKTYNQAVLCEVASLGAISEGIFSHLYIITLYLNAPYFSDPLLGDLERWDKQSLIDCWRHNAFLDLLGLIPEALPSTCPASMDEGRELTGWRKGAQTWDPRHAGILCFTDSFLG